MEPRKEDLYRFPFSKNMGFREYVVKSGVLDHISIVMAGIEKKRKRGDPEFDPLEYFVQYFGGDPKTFILRRENDGLKEEKRRLLDIMENMTDEKVTELIWNPKIMKRHVKLETLVVQKISSESDAERLTEFLKKHRSGEFFKTLIFEEFVEELAGKECVVHLYSAINEIENLKEFSSGLSLEMEDELILKLTKIKRFIHYHRSNKAEISPEHLSRLSKIPRLKIIVDFSNLKEKGPTFHIDEEMELLVGFEGIALSSFPKLKNCSKNITELSFRGCEFTKIPTPVFNQFRSLESIILDSCTLKNNKLPAFQKFSEVENIELTNLSDPILFKKLDLSSCMKSLKHLSFKNSPIGSPALMNIFKQASSPLEILNCCNCGLKRLEKEISNLTNLKILDISKNEQITKLPIKQINEMDTLEQIILCENDENLTKSVEDEINEKIKIIL